jgi:hypothetical protein
MIHRRCAIENLSNEGHDDEEEDDNEEEEDENGEIYATLDIDRYTIFFYRYAYGKCGIYSHTHFDIYVYIYVCVWVCFAGHC